MSQLQLPQLLLRNDKVHRNLCSLNSILQLLRHIPEFLSQLSEWKNASPILIELSQVLSKTGRNEVTSALQVRHLLAQATGQPLNSGAQYDTVELFSYLLEHCPSQLFTFSVDHQYRFRVNDHSTNQQNAKRKIERKQDPHDADLSKMHRRNRVLLTLFCIE